MIEAPPVSEPSRSRTSVVPTCVATRKDGQPCGGAAVQGSDRCWRHSEQEQRTRERKASDSIPIVPLPDLVALDVSDAATLKRFRRGIMAHVARGTLGVQEARALLEVALSIHRDDHGNDQAQAFTTLATSIAAQLAPK